LARRRAVAVLDLGTSKVLAGVGVFDGDAGVRVTGVGQAASRGLRRGVVVDLDLTAEAIVQAVERAQRMAGERVTAVLLGISGGQVTSLNSRGTVVIPHGDEIRDEDVERVLQAARAVSIPSDHEVVHVVPRHFVVDGYEGVRDPVGMAGRRLEVETHIVACPVSVLQNAWRAVDRAGIAVADLALNGLAAAEAVLLPEERELGVALADVGGGATDVVVFRDGGPVYSAVLPLGGDHITADVAVCLRTSHGQAEALKVEHGVALPELADEGAVVEVAPVAADGGGEGERRRVPARVLAEIIEARLEELLRAVGEVLRRSGHARALPAGLVLTGGTARLRGVGPLAMRLLDLPTRTGVPHDCGGMEDLLGTPSHAAAVGLLRLAANRLGSERHAAAAAEGTKGIAGRFRAWLQGLF
jgi:cell division protein FtsA